MTAMAPDDRAITIGEDLFQYWECGRGRPLVLLHGAPADRHVWLPHMRLLGRHFRCFAYTQRWFGDASWRADGPVLSTATHAEDLAQFIGALDIAPAALVAWSYSGHVALEALVARPDLFERALVYEPGVASYVTDPVDLVHYARDIEDLLAPVRQAIDSGNEASGLQELEEGLSGAGTERNAGLERPVSNAVLALLSGRGEMATPISAQALRDISLPVTIAWGARTRLTFAIPSRAAASLISTGQHGEVADAGHSWPSDDPDGFCALARRRLLPP